ncbi:M48 family metallopeptidase [Photobacterium angustum]|uniref:M48 family metallopeptidase n=1 Tax=Photobacterium angustum TaxID=661 RepID=UPI0005E03587|nr:M48 family metallopeptidase [Photobacterium angustum]KJG18763.1 Zn-dependent protease [Photobacterium angustum]KJG25677.1 Zn-dependent protease [Photobacterium angustum]KJG33862.1 Zn-dependent protease [Photobacterium angustum]PSW95012.1 Zn-dependent protease [Photobacterium angustum]PSX04271.1 Zn-dependent protease [Photobacterium angustum]
MNVTSLRHPKENLYKMLCIIIGGLIWVGLLLGTLFSILIFLIPVAFFIWLSSKFFQASIFGNAVHVNKNQYTNLNNMADEIATVLDMKEKPEMFIVNSQGLTNALAVKFLSRKYTLLFSDLVDLLWEEKKQDQLRFVIAHELAHHAAGHVNFWINLLMKPAMFIPFLGSAYSRACELTCDRIATEIINNKSASINALITLASGSRELVTATNNDSFVQQELSVPTVFGFLQEITSSHPRMTKRVIAINNYQLGDQESTLIAREA